MRMKLLTYTMLLSAGIYGQTYKYVNTNNLLARTSPLSNYDVYAVLHAPTQVEIRDYPEEYANNKSITGKYYYITYTYYTLDGIFNICRAWVDKRYIVDSWSDITIKGVDTSILINQIRIGYCEDTGNAQYFPPAKYKGGSPRPQVKKKPEPVFIKGPYGGCYYINARFRKVYVDPSNCRKKSK